MTDIICVVLQKGGVGKTSTALALTAGARARGRRTLTIDLDPQCNLSLAMGADMTGISILDVLAGNVAASEAIQATPQGEMIPATGSMSSADLILNTVGKEYRLKESLEPILGRYDCIVLDCPPALGVLTVNALAVSSRVVIPAQADIFSVQGIAQLFGTIDTVRRYCNPSLTVAGVLLTRYNPRSVLAREMRDVIGQTATQNGAALFKSFIRESTAIKEAQTRQQSIFDYAPRSNGAADYGAFLDEIM